MSPEECYKRKETANMFVWKAISDLTLTYSFIFLSSTHKHMLFASTKFSLNMSILKTFISIKTVLSIVLN